MVDPNIYLYDPLQDIIENSEICAKELVIVPGLSPFERHKYITDIQCVSLAQMVTIHRARHPVLKDIFVDNRRISVRDGHVQKGEFSFDFSSAWIDHSPFYIFGNQL